MTVIADDAFSLMPSVVPEHQMAGLRMAGKTFRFSLLTVVRLAETKHNTLPATV